MLAGDQLRRGRNVFIHFEGECVGLGASSNFNFHLKQIYWILLKATALSPTREFMYSRPSPPLSPPLSYFSFHPRSAFAVRVYSIALFLFFH